MVKQSRRYTSYSNYGTPARANAGRVATKRPGSRLKRRLGLLLALIVVAGGVYGGIHLRQTDAVANTSVKQSAAIANAAKKAPTAAPKAVATPASNCPASTSGKLLLVSISKRHFWACDGTSQLYDSAVVTGMENLAADLTPTGTYHIYAKQTNLYLNGSDSTGSWHDYVNYWMPWLHNQYGSYGFHDATWRDPSAFGNISPYSSTASHGCVEMPLAAAKWVYNWAEIGTTVTVVS